MEKELNLLLKNISLSPIPSLKILLLLKRTLIIKKMKSPARRPVFEAVNRKKLIKREKNN